MTGARIQIACLATADHAANRTPRMETRDARRRRMLHEDAQVIAEAVLMEAGPHASAGSRS